MYQEVEVGRTECWFMGSLRAGDILVTKSNTGNSKFIQASTCAPVSHALVMVNAVHAVEANTKKVDLLELTKVFENNDRIMLLRHRTLSGQQGLQVADFLMKQRGKPYDKLGAVRSATLTGFSGVNYGPLWVLVTVLDNVSKLTDAGHDKSFYCSELVARAFEYAGAPLTSHRPRNVSPGALLQSEMLQIIRTLK